MAREIDFSKPLDEDDIHYLRARTWLVDEAELQGFSIRDQVHNGLSEQDSDEESGNEEQGEEEIDYSEASVAELKAELERRNLPVGGNKPELIARLEEDDANSEEEEEEDE